MTSQFINQLATSKSLTSYCFAFLLLCTYSCAEKKAINVGSQEPNHEYLHLYKSPTETLHFKGKVRAMDKRTIRNAKVTIGDSTVLTDENGNFELVDHPVDRDFISITVTYEGFKSKSIVLTNTTNLQSLSITIKPYDSLSMHWFSKHNYLID